MICQGRSVSLTLVPFTFCWHGHCKRETARTTPFFRIRRRSIKRLLQLSSICPPPYGILLLLFHELFLWGPLFFFLWRKNKIGKSWRKKSSKNSRVHIFWAILLGYVLCTLNSSRAGSITFFFFSVCNPVFIESSCSLSLSFLFCFPFGDRINGNNKEKGEKKKKNLFPFRDFLSDGRITGETREKFPFLFHSLPRSIRRCGTKFISLLSYCILLLSFDMISIRNYWASWAGCPIAWLKTTGRET